MNYGFIVFAGLFVIAAAAVIVKDFIESWKDRRDFEEYLNAKSEEER